MDKWKKGCVHDKECIDEPKEAWIKEWVDGRSKGWVNGWLGMKKGRKKE